SGFDRTDVRNVGPLLDALKDNGGPTKTMALLPGSPAIDAGDNKDTPEFDQRGPGFPRIVNDIIDIGAFEVQAPSVSKLLLSVASPVIAGAPFNFTVTALDGNGNVATGYTGTVHFTSSDPYPGV